MGKCSSKKEIRSEIVPQPQIQLAQCSIKSQIEYFDRINLEQLSFPDLSRFLGRHIRESRIVDDGKTWLALKDIAQLLDSKTEALLGNFNVKTDGALQIIYSFQKLHKSAILMQSASILFDEQTICKYQYFQVQLVQISLEVVIAVNTLISKNTIWWDDGYFNWRKNYIQTLFEVDQLDCSPQNSVIVAIKEFILILQSCANKLSAIKNSKVIQSNDSIDQQSQAQQVFLQNFYHQMKQNFGATLLESIEEEYKFNSVLITQRVSTHALLIKNKK